MNRATAALLVCGAAVVVAAEFIVIGLLPAVADGLALSPAGAGWLVTAFALASALLGPLLVTATRRFPPTRVLAAALLPFAGNLLLLAAPSFPLLLGLRIVQGATLPVFMSLAGAMLGTARGTGPGVAILYVGVTIGGTLAPPAASFLAERLGWAPPMAMIGSLALVIALGCLAQTGSGPIDRAGSPWRLLARPAVQAQLLLSALTFATMFAGFSYIALLLDAAGLRGGGIAAALLAFGIAGLGGNWLAGRVASHALPATAGAALATAAMTACLAVSPGTPALGLVILVWGAAHAAGFVSSQIRVMDEVPDAPGFAGSLNIAAANIGIAAGSIAGGRAIEFAGAAGVAGTAVALALMTAGVATTCRLRNVSKPSLFRNRTETEIAPD